MIRFLVPRGLLFAVSLIVFMGCSEKDSLSKEKLDRICKSDLDSIAVDLPKASLADSMYFTIVSYKSYSEGKYSKMAVVDYYFLKNIKAKIVRKYRYLKEVQLWDRYFNEYSLFNDTASSSLR